MPIIIDRFEGNFAVCEDGDERVLLPRAALPCGATEGDVLVAVSEGKYALDTVSTAQRREKAQRRLAALISPKKN